MGGVSADVLRLRSVTSIIADGLGKNEGLLYWAAGEAATCALDSRATIEAMLAEQQSRDDVWKWIRDARFRTMQRAQARGTELHRGAEQYALGAEPLLAPEAQPYFAQYRRWLDTYKPKTLMAEAAVYNPSERYAGTLDGIVELNGQTVLYDIKTTAHGPEKERRPPFLEVALQLVAYSRATHVGVLPAARETDRFSRRWYDFDPNVPYETMPKIEGAICVVVSPVDCFARSVDISDSTWLAFQYVREIGRWQAMWESALFGPQIVAKREVA